MTRRAIRLMQGHAGFDLLSRPIFLGQRLQNRRPSMTDYLVLRCYSMRSISKQRGNKMHRTLRQVHLAREYAKRGIMHMVWPRPARQFAKVVR